MLISLVQFNSGRHLRTREWQWPCWTLPVSQNFPHVAFETVPTLALLTVALSLTLKSFLLDSGDLLPLEAKKE